MIDFDLSFQNLQRFLHRERIRSWGCFLGGLVLLGYGLYQLWGVSGVFVACGLALLVEYLDTAIRSSLAPAATLSAHYLKMADDRQARDTR
jgi:uncharacterized membrane protein YccC